MPSNPAVQILRKYSDGTCSAQSSKGLAPGIARTSSINACEYSKTTVAISAPSDTCTSRARPEKGSVINANDTFFIRRWQNRKPVFNLAETRRFELLKGLTPYLVSSEAHSTGLCDVSELQVKSTA